MKLGPLSLYLSPMSIFPTQYSTLSSAALGDFLKEKYELPNVTCRLLIHNVSDTYILEGIDDKFIFKIYRDRHRQLPEIKAEVELLNILHQNGAKVAYPISAKDGSEIQSFDAAEGLRYGVLFSYAKGEPIYAMSNKQLELLGKEMALLHQITSSVKLAYPRKHYDLETTIRRPIAVIEPAFQNLKEEYRYLVQAGERVVQKLTKMDSKTWSYGYCHFDFLPKNFHFESENTLTFFDFDFAGKGLLANDIASFYVHFFFEILLGKITQEEANRSFKVFIAGYRSVKSLTDEELKAVPYLGFGFWIFYLGFQFENFEDCFSHFFGPKYLKDRVGLLKKWMDWYIDTEHPKIDIC